MRTLCSHFVANLREALIQHTRVGALAKLGLTIWPAVSVFHVEFEIYSWSGLPDLGVTPEQAAGRIVGFVPAYGQQRIWLYASRLHTYPSAMAGMFRKGPTVVATTVRHAKSDLGALLLAEVLALRSSAVGELRRNALFRVDWPLAQ